MPDALSDKIRDPEIVARLNESLAGTYFDRQGQPITWSRWSELFSDTDYKIVRRTPVGDLIVVTAWLGSDHGFGWNTVPAMIFGTIVQKSITFEDSSEIFAATEDEALVNHERFVEVLTTSGLEALLGTPA
jgi:hypothetical protein